MSVRLHGGGIVLEGRCAAEDAETLLTALRDRPEAPVDVSGVQKLHMAVLQVLLALRPTLRGRTANGPLQEILHRHIAEGDSAPKTS